MEHKYKIIILVLTIASLIMAYNILTLYRQEYKTNNKKIHKKIHKKINNGDIILISDIIYILLVILVSLVMDD